MQGEPDKKSYRQEIALAAGMALQMDSFQAAVFDMSIDLCGGKITVAQQ